MLRLFFSIIFAVAFLSALAQDRCGTVAYEKLRNLRNPNRETIDQFERWMTQKLVQKSTQSKSDRTAGASYVIPIVVHVIHNGEAIGTGTNISDAQILSQIDVINNDFQRLNADTTKTLTEFAGVAGKFPITFEMARQDPNGQATNGIVRVTGSQTSWEITDNYTLKALSYWPAEDYFNIWIAPLSGGLLGYTQLPVSSTLQGLTDASDDRLTDGVVIHYASYGTAQAPGGSAFKLLANYNLGRTATHEIGHFFGLRHVWGDENSCSSTDYVSDTPVQNTNYNGLCPSGSQTECNGHTMYANYMNYTDDACMNIFSKGQADRMFVIINNSPRRTSLVTSHGLNLPAPVGNDLGIRLVASPGATACSGNITPSVTVRNYGANNISDAQIEFFLNGSPVETQPLPVTPAAPLAPAGEMQVNFSPVSLTAGATDVFTFQVTQTNSTTDGNPSNDTLSITTRTPVAVALPLLESFNSVPSGWRVDNPDGLVTWAATSIGSKNTIFMDFYNYDNSGAMDLLVTPVLDLTSATVASLSFDLAYTTFSGGGSDGLRVLVTSVCDFSSSTEIFNKSGSALATAPATGSEFVPVASQWVTNVLSLNQFIGQKIQIAFQGINGYGNNLYLDNVSVFNSPVTDFSLTAIAAPSPVTCQSAVSPVITVRNTGNMTITSLQAKIYVNSQVSVEAVSGFNLPVGGVASLTLAPVSLQDGNNALAIAIDLPNGVTLNSHISDSLHLALIRNAAAEAVPLRKNFNDNELDSWSAVSPQSGTTWLPANTQFTPDSISLVFHSFGNTSIGEQGWLVSPVLDFSQVNSASVVFETSYAYNPPGSETLQVLASTDCGETFNLTLQTFSATGLANIDLATSWVPSLSTHWTKNQVALDALAGKANVRIAFVATNDDGNNLYIDNIEFYTDDLSSHLVVDTPYAVYGGLGTPVKVTFNLAEKEPVRVQAYDLMGHVVADDILPDTLNQTYTVGFPQGSYGLYIIRIQTSSGLSSTKVLLGN